MLVEYCLQRVHSSLERSIGAWIRPGDMHGDWRGLELWVWLGDTYWYGLYEKSIIQRNGLNT